ncbi:putative tail fiber [Caudoviricetes sp.]|nr:MAG: putative tail fiber [Podoviridae sp. ct2cs2]UOF77503.1 putative tail fiber [Caudoviricetes sp.]
MSVIINGTTGIDTPAITGMTTPLSVAQGGTGATSLASANLPATNAANTFTASQRGTVTTDNDGSFDMSVTNNFKCTPTGTFALTFTNITAGQSGYVLLVNTGGYTVTAASTTKVNTTFLTTVTTAGTYLLSYFTDGTNVYVTTGGAMS